MTPPARSAALYGLLCGAIGVIVWLAYEIKRDDVAPLSSERAPLGARSKEPETSGKMTDEEMWFAELTELTSIRLDVADTSLKYRREWHERMRKYRFSRFAPSSWFVDGRNPNGENPNSKFPHVEESEAGPLPQ